MRLITVLFLLLFTAVLAQAQEPSMTKPITYGHPVDTAAFWTMDGLMGLLNIKERAYVTAEAIITSSCQRDGCWMDVAVPNDRTMKVICPADGFRVPLQDLAGRRVLMRGTLQHRMVDEATARRYAEEAGSGQEHVTRIIGPIAMLVFDADGVVIFP